MDHGTASDSGARATRTSWRDPLGNLASTLVMQPNEPPARVAQRSFVITDPYLPDNPIVFASGAFLAVTGYTTEQVCPYCSSLPPLLRGQDGQPLFVECHRA